MESWDPGRGPDSFVGTRESWRTLERGLWYFRKADLWSFSVREAAKQYTQGGSPLQAMALVPTLGCGYRAVAEELSPLPGLGREESPRPLACACVLRPPLLPLAVWLSCKEIICASRPKLKVTGGPGGSCSFLCSPGIEWGTPGP